MAEETVVITDRIELRLDRLEQGQIALREDVAELKGMRGVLEQMDRRVSSVEQTMRQMQASMDQNQRWLIGLILGSWVTLAPAILGLYLKG